MVAVATGVHSVADLREAGAGVVLPDLTDTAALLAHFECVAAECD
ncbi:hypothetical protein [Kitasatospora sp. NBC_01266]|nr:hypothetical protein [Kitasatospora sp. NBC_01266]